MTKWKHILYIQTITFSTYSIYNARIMHKKRKCSTYNRSKNDTTCLAYSSIYNKSKENRSFHSTMHIFFIKYKLRNNNTCTLHILYFHYICITVCKITNTIHTLIQNNEMFIAHKYIYI